MLFVANFDFTQVIALAVNNRKLKLPENADELHENNASKDFAAKKLSRTSQFSYVLLLI